MRESEIEDHLRKCVSGIGGVALKFTSPERAGVPDRIVLLPGGRIDFIELKAPGEKAEPHQLREHQRLRALGFNVYVIDSITGVNSYIRTRK